MPTRSILSRLLALMTKWAVVAAIWGGVALAAVLAWYAADLPSVDKALAPTRRPMITVIAADGSEIATLGDIFGRPVTLGELPPVMAEAVLAIEDRRFYRHFGVDLIRVAGAAVANVKANDVVQGGSTITQQLAKNMFLTPERTIKRKVQEVLLALWLEQRFTKDQILTLYLNRAYFGAGAYGVDAAAEKFFARPATRLSTYQAAMLAGLLKAPSRFNPIANPQLAAERTRIVLIEMVDAGYLTAAEAQAAWRDRTRAVRVRETTPAARYFVDWVAAQAPSFAAISDRDVTIYTTLDPRLQRAAEQQLEALLATPEARRSGAGQAALVAMSLDGAVRAMVGGREYAESSFNRATQAIRQPGSAFKPIVYAAALEQGLSADARMTDGPIQIAGWAPQNFSESYRGDVSLREALAQSINTVAVQVGQYAGIKRVVALARRLGITSDLKANASLSLGSSGVTLIELTGAYTAIANGGRAVWPYGIEEIRDGRGEVLYRRSGSGGGQVLSAHVAREITSMMVSAVEWGTGRAARIGRPVAGKTGTSQDYRDAWFVGFSARLVSGVWMGNDDQRSMNKVTGGTLPAKLWAGFMAEAEAPRPALPLPSLDHEAVPPTAARQPERPQPQPDFFDRLMRVFGG
jgi:penicillin-binding protein 1A